VIRKVLWQLLIACRKKKRSRAIGISSKPTAEIEKGQTKRDQEGCRLGQILFLMKLCTPLPPNHLMPVDILSACINF